MSQPQNRAPETEEARVARLREAVRLRDGGMTFTQLGDHFDVGRERAKILVERGRKLPPLPPEPETPEEEVADPD
jgi:hypothetical protein